MKYYSTTHRMEHRLVAHMMVAIVLAGGVAGSVLHAPGVPIQHLLPLEVVHSPIVLSQPLGLSVNEILAAAGYEQSPAPVAEESLDESAEAKQILEILNSQQLSESAGSVAIGDAGTHLTVSGPALPAPAALGEPAPSAIASESQSKASSLLINELPPPSPAPESQPSPAPETPQPAPPPSPAPAPESLPLPTPTATDVQLLESLSRGSISIDANGKLQMQATVTSDGSGLSVVAAELPQVVDAVPVVVPEVPVVTVTKPSKGVSNVNVNVNVNVNGDGTASSFNATSVSKINAPIEVEHEYH